MATQIELYITCICQIINKLNYCTRYFFNRFRHCDFRAVVCTQIEDLNRDKPVCLKTGELRGDRIGTPIPSSQEGCLLDIGVGNRVSSRNV